MPTPGDDIFGELATKKKSMDEARSALTGAVVAPPKAPPAAPPQQVDKIHPKAKFGSNKGETRLPVDQWTKPLGSFKNGTDYVPKTGAYKLHEGEAVKTAKENMDPMALVPGRTEPKPKKEIHEIRSRKTHSGGIIHEHHHTHPEHHKMEEHTSPDAAAAGAHVASMLGGDAGTPPVDPAAAGPAAGPAAGAPAMAPPAAPAV
jgi:hypothetical protein